MKKQRILIVVLVIGLLVAAVGVASAQGRDNRGRQDGQPRQGSAALMLLRQVAEATGLTAQDVYTKLSEGMTFSDILTEANVDVEQFKADLLATVQENAATRLENLSTQLDAALTQVFEDLPQMPQGDLLKRASTVALGRQVMDATGLTARDLYTKAADGMTYAQILTEANVDIEQFKADVIADAQERAATAVTNGRITQERADALVASVTENLDAALNAVIELPQRPFDGRDGRGGNMDSMFGRGFGGIEPMIPNPAATPTAPGGSL